MATEHDAGYGRGALIGGALGFAVAAAIVASIALFAGFSRNSALGIGAFAALWGGLGLGSMMGAITVLTREMHADRR